MKLLVACDRCQTQYDVSGRGAGDSFHCRCGATVKIQMPAMRDARIVRCASCGAARNDGENCGFCGARFSAVDKGWGGMCPRCYCRLPNDANFCVECGLRINPQKLEAVQTQLLCPRCRISMATHQLGGITITECNACAGVWLAVEIFEQICRSKETQELAAAGLRKKGRGRKNVFELSVDEQVKYVPCPQCKNLMNRRNFARVSGVIIDTCRDCGVWLDNQELGRIIQFINAGGMDKYRDIEMREHTEAARNAARSSKTPSLPLQVTGMGDFSFDGSHHHTLSEDLLKVAIAGVVSGVKALFN